MAFHEISSIATDNGLTQFTYYPFDSGSTFQTHRASLSSDRNISVFVKIKKPHLKIQTECSVFWWIKVILPICEFCKIACVSQLQLRDRLKILVSNLGNQFSFQQETENYYLFEHEQSVIKLPVSTSDIYYMTNNIMILRDLGGTPIQQIPENTQFNNFEADEILMLIQFKLLLEMRFFSLKGLTEKIMWARDQQKLLLQDFDFGVSFEENRINVPLETIQLISKSDWLGTTVYIIDNMFQLRSKNIEHPRSNSIWWKDLTEDGAELLEKIFDSQEISFTLYQELQDLMINYGFEPTDNFLLFEMVLHSINSFTRTVFPHENLSVLLEQISTSLNWHTQSLKSM